MNPLRQGPNVMMIKKKKITWVTAGTQSSGILEQLLVFNDII